jgi:hypothetical protein|tara:strand:+ start:162 stop:485 length:324 start_codon:yes stop_codon:yes gene_type:complete
MASPYKMKNSMLKMAVKGAPMQKNYGSPLHQDKYVPPGVVSNKKKSKFKNNPLENIITSASNAFNTFKSKDNKSKGNKNVYVPPGVINNSNNYAKKAKSLVSKLFKQ